MEKLFILKQDEKKFWERDKPVRVHRARHSPTYGTGAEEEVHVTATVAEAKAWVAAQGGKVVSNNWRFK